MTDQSKPLENAWSNLIVRGVRSQAEMIAANRLVARTQQFDERKALAWLESAGQAWPGFEFEKVRVALADDQIIGALRVIDVPLRIGEARLRAGGIGWVSTHAAFRGMGICSALMADAHAFMAINGYDLALLFGIPDLYQRYGYVSAIPERSIVVDVKSLPTDLIRRHSTRGFLADDIPAMLAMHDAAEREASCSIVRHREWVSAQAMSSEPKTPLFPDWPGTVALTDAADQFAGWLMPQVGEDEYHIKDLGAGDLSACESLLVAAASRASQAGYSRVRFHVPPFHLFARYLERFNSTHETRVFRQSEGMLAIIHVIQTLSAMIPEWRVRLASWQSGQRSWQLHLVVEGVPIAIVFEQGEIRIGPSKSTSGLHIERTELLLLLTGCHRAEDTLSSRWSNLDIEQRRMVEILFPRREPFIWPIDHF